MSRYVYLADPQLSGIFFASKGQEFDGLVIRGDQVATISVVFQNQMWGTKSVPWKHSPILAVEVSEAPNQVELGGYLYNVHWSGQ